MKKIAGCSPTDYIKKIQLNNAERLIREDFGNISEVAYASGFNNLSYFAKCFKNKYGISPGSYTYIPTSVDSLPLELTNFVGRKKEIETLKECIRRHRLVSLTGPAGTGKTRLALEVVKQSESMFQNGVSVIYLAPVSDPDLVPTAIMQQLHIIEHPAKSMMENLVTHLKDKNKLLFLDNFEHLMGAAPRVKTLLQQCPELTILTTSREVLHLSGEHEFPLLPLPVPEMGVDINAKNLPAIKSAPSIELFAKRARMVKSGFRITPANARDVVQICTDLDGLPLAIELAASQVKVLSPSQLKERLNKDIGVLQSGEIDRPKRHTTLQRAISWSYELLSESEKKLFQRISLFAGSFSLDAVEALWEDESAHLDTLEGIRSLLDKNFIQTVEIKGEVRYRLLETLKSFGKKELHKYQDEKQQYKKIAEYLIKLAHKAEPHLRGDEQKYWVEILGKELDNFRGILSFLEQNREARLGLQLSRSLCRYWNMQNLIKEGCGWLQKMIGIANTLKIQEETGQIQILKGRALSALGVLLSQLAENLERAEEIIRQSLRIFRRIDHKEEIARNLNHYGWIKAHIGDYKEALSISEEGKRLNQVIGSNRGISVAYNNLGWIAYARGELENARELYNTSIKWRKKAGDHRGIAYVNTNLARVEKEFGEFDRALSRLDESFEVLRELNDVQLISWVHTIKAYVYYDMGHYSMAKKLFEKAIPGWKKVGNHYGISLSNGYLGLTNLQLQRTDDARQAVQQSNTHWNRMNSKWGASFNDYCLGQLNAFAGNYEKALKYHETALTRRISQNEKLGICESLEATAAVMSEQDRFEETTVYLATAGALRNRIKAPHTPRNHDFHRRLLSRCKENISPKLFGNIMNNGYDASLRRVKRILHSDDL